MQTVIFDIDGTLADVTHRRHHIAGGKRDWNAFFSEMQLDPVIDPIRRLNQMVYDSKDATVVLCSGRPETYREVTEAWLAQYGIVYDALYMRPADDTRPDHVVKAEMLASMRAEGKEPFLVVDDRPSVVRMWRENGLVCLQCNDGWAEKSETNKPGLLTLMVGPSGAGKTTWLASSAATALGIRPSHVVSSDQIRADLCGDFRDQTRNEEVFAAVHGVVKARLAHGLPAVVDATNLRRKDRLAAAGLAPDGGMVRYIVLNRPMAEKRRDAGWRAELAFDLLEKHEQTFRSQIKDILAGDDLPHVEVIDLCSDAERKVA